MDKKQLYQALRGGDWESVHAQVDSSPDALTAVLLGQSLLNHAAEQGRLEEVRWLVARGLPADFSDGCLPPIVTAIDHGEPEIAAWLVGQGVDVNASHGGRPLIFGAVLSGSPELVALLIDAGADLNCSLGVWKSPLAQAEAAGNRPIVALLTAGTEPQEEAAGGAADPAGALDSAGAPDSAGALDSAGADVAEPLGEAELRRLEEVLGVTIPAAYRAFLSDFPDDLVTEGEEGVFHSAELIRRSTERSRAYQEEDWPGPYPRNLIDVGWNGGGSVYCVRTGGPGDELLLFDHETGDLDPAETLTLPEWIAWGRRFAR